METVKVDSITLKLKQDVQNHPILQHKWLYEKSKKLNLEDLHLWLSQEYFVSVDFVNWFLIVASQTNHITAKIILTQNIWEELGEGVESDSHVKILEKFLRDTNFSFDELKILPSTKKYLEKMREIIQRDFYSGLGALGPANEYLLKLEYGKIYNAYKKLQSERNLPEAHFFQVNLDADESHSCTHTISL